MPHRYPETHVLYRNLARTYPLVIRGEGCWLYDSEGRNYLDACGGAFVACLGHGVSEVVDAMSAQFGASIRERDRRHHEPPKPGGRAGRRGRRRSSPLSFSTAESDASRAQSDRAAVMCRAGKRRKELIARLPRRTTATRASPSLARGRTKTTFSPAARGPRALPVQLRCACRGAIESSALQRAVARGKLLASARAGARSRRAVGGSSTGPRDPGRLLAYHRRFAIDTR